nr:hypothetical protein [uncultured Roseateles sp.]
MSVDDYLHRLAGSYVAAPQWVKTLVGGVYAQVPPSLRFGRRYGQFKREFSAPAPVSPALIEQRLAQTLGCALASVPAFEPFRHLLDQARRDPFGVLAQLPLCSKEDLKLQSDRYLSVAAKKSERQRMFTGGSTSVPMTFYLHKGVSRAKEWAAVHVMADRLGTEGRDVVLAMRGRTVRGAQNADSRIWMYEPIKKHLILSSDHLEPEHMQRYVEALRRWRPRYVHAFPSALHPLLVWLRAHGQEDLLSQVEGVLLTSESVFDHHLAAFKAFFKCPVIVHYGHSERVLFAHTLADDPRYHFWPHYGHLELVDANGAAVTRLGQVGELVGTSFDNEVMPFVRYRTGDYAVLGGEAAAGWAGYPVCERIEGRVQEFVVCRDRRLITITTLGAAHFEQLDHCLRIQFEQSEPGKLILRVVPLKPLSDAAKREIQASVELKTQGGCSVQVEEVTSIPVTERGKQRLLVQHLPIAAYLGASMDEMPTEKSY